MAPGTRGDPEPFARIARFYDALMASVPYGMWADYVSFLAGAADRPIEPGVRLLDLATGTGSVALEFAARGCTVTGLDRSAPMLAEADRKARARGLDVDFLCRDLADFQLPASFEFAVCLYDSFNYLLDSRSLKQAFANVRGALVRGGLLIFDVNTVHALAAELFTQESPPGAPVRYRWVSKYEPRRRISEISMCFEEPDTGEPIAVTHRQRAYTEQELRVFLSEAGFLDICTYEAYQLRAPRKQSDRVFFVAHAG